MKKFSEFPFVAQLGITVAVGAVLVLGGEYFYLNDMRTANTELSAKVAAQKAENDRVRPIEKQFKDLKVDNQRLEQQLANLRNIVPDEKEADAFIRMVQEAGVQSGVNLRQFTAKANVQREFYIETPFQISLDGDYFTVLQFYDRLSKLSRIINVTNLSMTPPTGSPKGGGRRYPYSPSETVLAACTLTTFFSREATAQPGPGAKR